MGMVPMKDSTRDDGSREGRVEALLRLPWELAMRVLEYPMRGVQHLIGQGRMPYIFVLPNLLIFGTFVVIPLFINFYLLGHRRHLAFSCKPAVRRGMSSTPSCSPARTIWTRFPAARTISGGAFTIRFSS